MLGGGGAGQVAGRIPVPQVDVDGVEVELQVAERLGHPGGEKRPA